MQKSINTLTVTFNLPLYPHQIPQWRGAVIEAAGIENDLLHNHNNKVEQKQMAANGTVYDNGDTLTLTKAILSGKKSNIHRYPLVHYRSVKGKASIFAIGDGVEIIRRWLLQKNDQFVMNRQTHHLMIKGFQEDQFELKISNQLHTYRLMDWLALNEDYYKKWRAADRLNKRVEILESALTAHIMTFARGVDWQVPASIDAHLLNLTSMRKVSMHDMDRLAFNVLFRANVIFPAAMALGRAVAFGYGVQMPVRNEVF